MELRERMQQFRDGHIEGLEPHGPEQSTAMRAEFNHLLKACQCFTENFGDYGKLEAKHGDFESTYDLLKLLTVSAFNLLDFECPSLPPLRTDKEFELQQVERNGSISLARIIKATAEANKNPQPHTEEQSAAMRAEFNHLLEACQYFIENFGDYSKLEAKQKCFNSTYYLLKLLGVAALNLLDFKCPSLPLFIMDRQFRVHQAGDSSFLIFAVVYRTDYGSMAPISY